MKGPWPETVCATASRTSSVRDSWLRFLRLGLTVRGLVGWRFGRRFSGPAKARGQLVDQVFQDQGVLHQFDAVALLEKLLGAPRGDPDVLTAEQTRSHDGGVAIGRDAVEL